MLLCLFLTIINRDPVNKTISKGAPTASQVLGHAVNNYGGSLNYTDADACWKWASAEKHWREELMWEMSIFFDFIYVHALDYHYDTETKTFDLDSWDDCIAPLGEGYGLAGTFLFGDPDKKDPEFGNERISFGAAANSYWWWDAYYWIHNTAVQVDYTLSMSVDGYSAVVDLTMRDFMDFHPNKYPIDNTLDIAFPNYIPYHLKIDLGQHVFQLKRGSATPMRRHEYWLDSFLRPPYAP